MSGQAIQVVVEWWCQWLSKRAPHDAGDKDINMWLMQVTKRPDVSEEQETRFCEALKERCKQAILKHGSCTISTDYSPEGILEAVCDEIGLPNLFPCKTIMWVAPDEVTVACGYGARRTQLFKEESNETTTLD